MIIYFQIPLHLHILFLKLKKKLIITGIKQRDDFLHSNQLCEILVMYLVYVRFCQWCKNNSELKILPIDQPEAQFETQINDQQNSGFGIWFQWQPKSHIKHICKVITSIGGDGELYQYFLYFVRLKDSQTILKLLLEQDSDCESIRIALIIQSDFFLFEKKSLFFENDLEGVWMFFYAFLDIQKQASFYLYQSDNKELRSINIKPNDNLQGTLIHKIGGCSSISSDGNQNLRQFTGRISSLIQGDTAFQNENAEKCFKLVNTCIEEKTINLIKYQTFSAANYEMFETQILQKKIYSLSGWFKLKFSKPFEQITVLKILQNVSYNLQQPEIKLTYSLENLDRVRITLCSFSENFQQYCEYLENQQLFDELGQWHYIQLSNGNQKNSVVFQIFSHFAKLTKKIEIFAFSYTGQPNLLFIGGDQQSQQLLTGIIVNLDYQSFCEQGQISFTLKCHYSCETCFGPFYDNCLACYTNDNYLFYLNSCICKIKIINNNDQVKCSTILETFKFIQVEEEELLMQGLNYLDSFGNIICSYGYFEYKNQCIKCPFFDLEQQHFNILCLDCYLKPKIFYLEPKCSIDSLSYFYDNKNVFQQTQRKANEIQYFELVETEQDQYDLKLLDDQIVENNKICKNGYFKQNDECQSCSFACLICENFLKCNQCNEGYFLNVQFQCDKCINCLQCELKNDKINCLQCPDKHYLDKETNQCTKCGQFCASCNENGFCNYCEDLQKYFISLKNGKDCEICSLENCMYCFHQPASFITNYFYKIYFTPYYKIYELNFDNTVQYEMRCSRCKRGFSMNQELYIEYQVCGQPPDAYQSCYHYYQFPNYHCLISRYRCFIITDNCSLCSDFHCFECNPGYYVDYATNSCMQCPPNCMICAQYYMEILPYGVIVWSHFSQDYKDYMTTILPKNKQIICLSCNDGYVLHNDECIQNCSKECLECKIINGKSTCIKCHLFGFEKSLNSNGHCQVCPQNCAACIDRDSEEIISINRYFIQNSANEKYTRFCYSRLGTNTKNTHFFKNQYVVNDCKLFKGCQKIISFTWNLFCDESQYNFYQNNSEDRFTQNYLMQDFFDKQILNLLEMDLFTNYLNEEGFTQININLNLVQGNIKECLFTKKNILKLNLLSTIFQLTDLNLKLFSENTCLLQNLFLQIFGFTSLTFENLQLQFYNIQITEDQINQINFFDCEIVNKPTQYPQEFSLASEKNFIFNILNFTIKNMNYKDKNIFQFTLNQSSSQTQIINVNNLTILDSKFENSSLIYINILNQNQKVQLTMNELKILNTDFYFSNLIKSEGGQNIFVGTMVFQNFAFSDILLISSKLFLLQNVQQASFSKITIAESNFQKNSYFLLSNNFECYEFKVQNLNISTSFFISNSVDLLYQTNENSTNNIVLVQFKIEKIKYDTFQTVLQLIKYQYCDILLNVTIFSIIEASYDLDDSKNLISSVQTLIHIDCLTCYLDKLLFERENGISEISIVNSEKIKITNSIFVQSRKNIAKNLHPSNYDCLKQSQKSYKFYYLYIEQYTEIVIDNLQIIDGIGHNSPFIIIEGTERQFSERIEIFNSQFLNNIMIISENNSTSSIIQIKSEKLSNVVIQNTTFSGNHLNAYVQDLQVHSSSTIFIQLALGSINVKDCKFSNNIIINSTDSILQFEADTIKIESSIFYQNNFLNFTKLVTQIIFEESTKEVSIGNLQSVYKVYSSGGNGYILAKNIQFTNLQVNESFSMKGGAFYINTFGDSKILIKDSLFSRNKASLFYNLNSFGGCFYIDSELSNLTLIVKNTTFENSFSRKKGGVFYLVPSDSWNYLKFQEITILNCFSIQSSFLDFTSASWKSMTAMFEFENIFINQTKSGFEEFLSQLDEFSTSESYYLMNSNPLIYVSTGNLTFVKCSIFSQVGVFFVQIDEGYNMHFVDIIVKDGVIFSSSLIKMNIQSGYQLKIKFSNFYLINLRDFSIQETQQTCQEQKSLIPFDSNCYKPNFDIASMIRLVENYAEILKNQLICNQQLFFTTKKQNFSLIQITNIENQHIISAKLIQFESTFCSNCQYGLINLLNIGANTQTNIEFTEIMIRNCICGLASCLTIMHDENQNYFQSSLIKQNTRMLQTLNYEQLYQQIKFQVVLVDSHFISNQAEYGGGICIIGIDTLMIKSNFFNNSATVGGAIFYVKNNSQFLLLQTSLTNNYAQIAGGLFLFDLQLQETEILEVYISNNNSSTSQMDVLEKPRSLTISIDGGKVLLSKKIISLANNEIVEQIITKPYKVLGYDEEFEILTFPSGQAIGGYSYLNFYSLPNIKFNLTFRIIALNQFQQHVTSLDGAQCKLSHQVLNLTNKQVLSDSNVKLSYYKIQYDSQTKDFNLDNLIINFNPYYAKEIVLRIFINCDCVQRPIQEKEPPFQTIKTINSYQLQLDVRTFPCQLGEYFNTTAKICTQCNSSYNQYQVILNATNCLVKDESKINTVQSQLIELKSNYWRPYYYSTKIENCFHLPQNCLGGWYPSDKSCTYGHIGALCEQCDLYNIMGNGYFAINRPYRCGDCNQIIGNVISIIIISLWTLISILMSVSSTITTIKQFQAQKYLILFGLKHLQNNSSAAVLIKIFTNYSQIIQTISTFQLKVPENFVLVFNSVGNPIEQMAYSLDCFLIKISNIPIIYFRIIWSLFMAFSYIFAFFILLGIVVMFKQVKFNISMITTAFIYIFIYLQPNVFQYLISLISFRVISEVPWISGNVSYRYDSNEHKTWLSSFCLPLFIFISFIVPGSMFYKLKSQKEKLDSTKVREKWGYLYNEYKLKAYYWEFVKMLEKECIIIVLSYYEDYITIKAPIVFLFIFAYSYLSASVSPYQTGQLNELDIQSTTICGISIIIGSAIYSAQNFNLIELVYPFYSVITILNAYFLLKIILKIFIAYVNLLHQYTDKIKELILVKFKKQLKNYPKLALMLESKSKKESRIKANFQKIKRFLIKEVRKNFEVKKSIQLESESRTNQFVTSSK